MIATIWKENKARRRKKEELTGGSKDEGWSETRTWKLFRDICSTEWKFEEWMRQKWGKGSARNIYRERCVTPYNEEAGNPTSPHLMPHACRFSSQTVRQWWRLSEPPAAALLLRVHEWALQLPNFARWNSRLNLWSLEFLDSPLRTRHESRGGLIYGPKKPQPYWAQGPNMTTSSQEPSLIPHLGPFKQSDPKWLTFPLVLIHARSTVPREVMTMLSIIFSQ